MRKKCLVKGCEELSIPSGRDYCDVCFKLIINYDIMESLRNIVKVMINISEKIDIITSNSSIIKETESEMFIPSININDVQLKPDQNVISSDIIKTTEKLGNIKNKPINKIKK